MSFKKTFSRWFLICLSGLITLVIVTGLGYLYMEAFLPDVSALRNAELQVPLKIYTSDGNLLAEFGQLQRMPLPYERIPPLLIDAVVATEDQHFFEHHGIDVGGLGRATWELLLTGTKSQGGSTITMQVARNFYLSREKTFGRKFNEILLALKIDRELPKEKIMELYLNKIYLGKRAYGVEAAARVYFGRPLNQLTLPELAVIAGLPKAPSTINPIADPVAAKARRDHVLDRMKDVGFIDEKTYQAAVATPLTAVNYHPPEVTTSAPYAAEMVRNLMEASYGSDAYTQGYKVYTTIDSKLQEDANQSVRDGILAYDQRHGFRGPEQNLGNFSDSKRRDWEDALANIGSVNGLIPVAVIDVKDKSMTVMDSNGQVIEIDAPAFAWTKAKSAKDIVKMGDVIRIERKDNQWVLSQLPKIQAALVSVDPSNGAIRDLVGGFSFYDSNYNRVTQALRQPGSSFKPFIYAAAFNKGFTLASVFEDAPLSFYNRWSKDYWEPGNDDNKYWGPMRLRMALANSRNTISIRLLQATGLDYTLDYLRNFGFNVDQAPHNLTLALGTINVTPLEMASAYSVFANGGYQVSPYIIDKVVDRKGNIIYQANPKTVCVDCAKSQPTSSDDQAKTPGVDDAATLPTADAAAPSVAPTTPNVASRVISPQVAFLVTQGMQEVVHSGTGAAIKALGRNDLAGKTGTTNDYMDAWFSGFNSDLVTTVWLGFDKPQPIKEYGAKAALPIWMSFMGKALAGRPEHTMAIPPGIVTAHIDPQTGAPTGLMGGGVLEYFDENHMPSGAVTHVDNVSNADVDGSPEESAAKTDSAANGAGDNVIEPATSDAAAPAGDSKAKDEHADGHHLF